MEADRIQKFEERQKELHKLSDEELKTRFWDLCYQVVDPIVDLAKTHTSPSIERSVLLRMGIDSITAHAVVDIIMQAGLLGKGAGNVVLKVAQKAGIDVQKAAAAILENKDLINGLFASSAIGADHD